MKESEYQIIDEAIGFLESLGNFNLIKHTGTITLTWDRGMGKPLMVQGESILDVATELMFVMQEDVLEVSEQQHDLKTGEPLAPPVAKLLKELEDAQ